MTSSLNREGVAETRCAAKEFHIKMQEILGNEKLQGETPFFSVAFCDSFIQAKENTSQNQEGLLQ
jgi:hypothetical protein